jgi:glycosyltransferase involved in cell wall biosynthesis
VKLVGEQQDVRPYLAAGDAFVMNSSSEGMPRALLEAMYLGLACVARDVGGIKGVLSGRGWVFDALSSPLLEAAITVVAAGGAEVQRRCQLASTYVAEHFDQEVTTRAYLECFGQL